jgi:hypothetical protein
MEEFVFGTKEAASPPTPPFVVSSAPTPTASLTSKTALPATPPPFVALPVATLPQPEASAPDPVHFQSKEPSLMSKLQAPDKEATVRFTVDISETLQRKLSMLAACDRAQEIGYCADVVGGWVKRRGLGIRIFFILCDRCTPRVAIAFAC